MFRRLAVFGLFIVAVVAVPLALAQPPGKGKGKGKGFDDAHQADMEIFHYLVDHGKQIARTITERPDGVETLTESKDAQIAEKIQVHVAAMKKRVEEKRPIHVRDPLFAEVFRHAEKITMTYEKTKNGVKVVETSKDPYVANLIKAHAKVVSQFIANGRAEMRKNHEVPEKK